MWLTMHFYLSTGLGTDTGAGSAAGASDGSGSVTLQDGSRLLSPESGTGSLKSAVVYALDMRALITAVAPVRCHRALLAA